MAANLPSRIPVLQNRDAQISAGVAAVGADLPPRGFDTNSFSRRPIHRCQSAQMMARLAFFKAKLNSDQNDVWTAISDMDPTPPPTPETPILTSTEPPIPSLIAQALVSSDVPDTSERPASVFSFSEVPLSCWASAESLATVLKPQISSISVATQTPAGFPLLSELPSAVSSPTEAAVTPVQAPAPPRRTTTFAEPLEIQPRIPERESPLEVMVIDSSPVLVSFRPATPRATPTTVNINVVKRGRVSMSLGSGGSKFSFLKKRPKKGQYLVSKGISKKSRCDCCYGCRYCGESSHWRVVKPKWYSCWKVQKDEEFTSIELIRFAETRV
ncbi:hypothetical protein B9Z55_025322 [Caenorhabditis nigoni]|uniref:Uncharacterized protein n=1 Tax=Caenorhabditis nigoni TaxID=1611254 RepID=A0A2G5SYG4_9PELO|nr:hypothetical protein B9Z55_025322 [Caenorhabditis nigoni]